VIGDRGEEEIQEIVGVLEVTVAIKVDSF